MLNIFISYIQFIRVCALLVPHTILQLLQKWVLIIRLNKRITRLDHTHASANATA